MVHFVLVEVSLSKMTSVWGRFRHSSVAQRNLRYDFFEALYYGISENQY